MAEQSQGVRGETRSKHVVRRMLVVYSMPPVSKSNPSSKVTIEVLTRTRGWDEAGIAVSVVKSWSPA